MNLREKQKTDLSAVKKILLIRLRRIGDVVMTTPAVALLKARLPQASVSYLVEEPYRELVEGNPHLDEVFVVPPKQGARDFGTLIRKIRKEKFDCLIDFHGGPRASWMTLFSGARLKIGYRIKNKGFLYDIRVPRAPEKGHVHSVENHVNLIRALGVEAGCIPSLFLPEADEEEKRKISALVREESGKSRKTVVLHVGAGNRFRDWGAGNLSRLIGLLAAGSGVHAFLVGGREDEERAEGLVRRSEASVSALAGKLGLRELRELIERSDLFIGTDSGPMHIAAATGTPMVVLFGPTLPAHFYPWKAVARIIERDLECRAACRQRECVHGDFRCLQHITAEEVCARCTEFL